MDPVLQMRKHLKRVYVLCPKRRPRSSSRYSVFKSRLLSNRPALGCVGCSEWSGPTPPRTLASLNITSDRSSSSRSLFSTKSKIIRESYLILFCTIILSSIISKREQILRVREPGSGLGSTNDCMFEVSAHSEVNKSKACGTYTQEIFEFLSLLLKKKKKTTTKERYT